MRKEIIFISALVMALSLSSCGEKTDISEESSQISIILSSSQEVVSELSEKPFILENNTKEYSQRDFSNDIEYIKPYKTLQECVDNSENIRSMIKSISDEENENTDSNVIIENDRIIFERTLKENTVYSENFAEEMEISLEEKKNEFIKIVNLFEWGVDSDNIKVVVRYKNKDDIIFEKEFTN